MAQMPLRDPFSDASDAFVNKDALQDRLLLITVYDSEDYPSTRPGKSETYRHFITDTVVLDGEPSDVIAEVPMLLEGFHFFGEWLVGPLGAKLRESQRGGPGMILGRLGKEPSAKKGNNDMDVLRAPEEADRDLARRWIADHPAADPFASA